MPVVKPESPLVIEEVLIKWGYRVRYKDEFVCVLENRNDLKEKPICIPQDVDEYGDISLEIMQSILFDARLDLFHYFPLLNQVKGNAPENKA